MSSDTLKTDMGSNIKIYETEKLGEGSYGSVYKCQDDNGKEYAVKCISMTPNGIPNALELSIMETIHHPNLNSAIQIHAKEDKVYIFQPLARTDVCKYTRKQNRPTNADIPNNNNNRITYPSSIYPESHERTSINSHLRQNCDSVSCNLVNTNNNKLIQHIRPVRSNSSSCFISPNLLKYWSFSLVQAVACLHQQNIIHGDIKVNNVFLFDKQLIKLGDFSLSIKVPEEDRNKSYYHRVCTYSHRPPECWFRKGWSFPLDIWSLGCTFFEIAYGRLLFPSQGKIQDKESKNLVYKKAVNCILDWIHRGPYQEPPPKWVKAFRPHLNIEYKKFTLPSRYHHPQYVEFNKLVLKMLQIDPSNRPTIEEILKDPYFSDQRASPYKIQSVITKTISRKETRRIEEILDQYNIHGYIRKASLELYRKSTECKDLSEKYKIISCVWLTHKLFKLPLPKHITQNIELENILESEKILCHHLNFRLHI
jgi:serine/threonine protein kinase